MSDLKPFWKYQSSFQTFSYIFYPSGIISSRSLCAKWLIPAGSFVPEWVRDCHQYKEGINLAGDIIQPILSPNNFNEVSPETNFVQSIVVQQLAPFKKVYNEEGILGLYRGLFMDVFYHLTKDLLLFKALTYCYPTVQSHVTTLKLFLCDHLSSLYKKDPSAYLEDDNTKSQEDINIDIVSRSITGYNDIEDEEMNGIYYPVKDISHLLIKISVDTLLYPLIVLKNRLVVYEGPQLLSGYDVLKLTFNFDGTYGGLYKGYSIYISLRLLENSADILCYRVCQKKGYSHHDINIIRDGVSKILNALISPLESFHFIETIKSNMPGLCYINLSPTDIFKEMSWKAILCTNIFTLITTFMSIKSSLGPDDN